MSKQNQIKQLKLDIQYWEEELAEYKAELKTFDFNGNQINIATGNGVVNAYSFGGRNKKKLQARIEKIKKMIESAKKQLAELEGK